MDNQPLFMAHDHITKAIVTVGLHIGIQGMSWSIISEIQKSTGEQERNREIGAGWRNFRRISGWDYPPVN